MQVVTRVVPSRPGPGEDRLAVISLPEGLRLGTQSPEGLRLGTQSPEGLRLGTQSPARTIIVLADGAGGMANGAMAAYHICEVTAKRCKRPSGSVDVVPDWAWWLSQLDQEMASEPSLGQAAVVIVEIRNDGLVTGASAGDCEAKVFATDSELLNLTEDQHRKPLLGDGRAVPTGFEARVKNGVLVVATDGLWKYRDSTKIVQEVATRPLELVGDSLVRGIWLENGCQPDDVALAIVEICEPFSA